MRRAYTIEGVRLGEILEGPYVAGEGGWFVRIAGYPVSWRVENVVLLDDDDDSEEVRVRMGFIPTTDDE